MSGRIDRLAVDQPMQQVQDVRLGRHASFRAPARRRTHGLFVMLEDKGKDFGHLTVTARSLEAAGPCTSGQSQGMPVKGAPLRRAPGLRWMTAR